MDLRCVLRVSILDRKLGRPSPETDEYHSMIAACHTATSYFNLWLKAEGYSVSKINYLPTGGNALAIVVTLAWGMIADRTGQFYWLIISLQFLMILSNILLSVWTIPKSALLFAYYISYAGSAATPVLIVSRPPPFFYSTLSHHHSHVCAGLGCQAQCRRSEFETAPRCCGQRYLLYLGALGAM